MSIKIVFGLVWLLLWAICAWKAKRVLDDRRGAERVTGEVIGYSDYVSHGRSMYSPIFRVVLAGGRTVERGAATGMATSWKWPKVGAKRTLLYRDGADHPLSRLGPVAFVPSIVFFGAGALMGALTLAAVFGPHAAK